MGIVWPVLLVWHLFARDEAQAPDAGGEADGE